MNCDAVDIVKSVSAIEAGRALGLELNYNGTRCKCPIHGGKDYNMRLFPDRKGYFCFVCHARGDVIGLVEAVLGVSFADAVKWLSDTFHLGVDIYKPVDREMLQRAKKRARMRKELHCLEREAEDRTFNTFLSASDFIRQLEQTIDECAPANPEAPWSERFCMALKLMPEARAVAEEAEVRMMDRSNVQ